MTNVSVVGVDIGNSTTEASVASIDSAGTVSYRGVALTRTTGIKGTVKNVEGVVKSVMWALDDAGISPADLDVILLNEATPVISGLAMETISSPASSERQANAHPCLRPETMLGRAAGRTTWR